MLFASQLVPLGPLLLAAALVGQAAGPTEEEPRVWTGSVIDERWRPLEGADLRIKWMRMEPGGGLKLAYGSKTSTGEGGNYQIAIPDKLAGEDQVWLSVRFSKEGYLTRDTLPIAFGELFSKETSQPQMGRGAVRRVLAQAQLRRGRLISGQVRMSNGRVARNAEVRVSTRPGDYDWKFPDPNRYYATSVTFTDRDGRYELLADTRATMRVRLKGHAEYSNALLPETATPQPVTHDVRMPGSIHPMGVVVDANGKPIARAIVRLRKLASRNSTGGSLGLSLFTAADENGAFNLPPVSAGTYTLTVNSRLADAARRDELETVGQTGRYGSRSDLYAPINAVIPTQTVEFGPEDSAADIELQGVPTNVVRVAITQDDPVGNQPKRAPLIPITGTFLGKRWSGYSVPTSPNKSAEFLVPSGVENVRISFGYALVKYPGDRDFRNATSIDIARIDKDLEGYAIHLTSLATLDVKILVPDELSISKVGTLSVFVTGDPHGGSTSKKQFGSVHHAGRTTRFSKTLPPNVKYWLHVESRGQSLHRQAITLKPGEKRPVEIDLHKAKK